MVNRLSVFLFLFLGILSSQAQTINISGYVFAFKGEKMLLLKKAQKNVSFDGSLGDVIVTLKGENTTTSIKTNLSGSFSLPLPAKGIYQLSVRREGYSALDMEIVYSDAGSKTRFESLYFILKQGEKSNVNVGSIHITDGGSMSYMANKKMLKDDVSESNSHLLEKACRINNSSNYAKSISNNSKENKVVLNPTDTIVSKISLEKNQPAVIVTGSVKDVAGLKLQLDEAKQQLTTLDPASEQYKILYAHVADLEQKIKDKELLIKLQESELTASRKIMTFLTLFIIALAGLALILFYFFKQKKSFAFTLLAKNKEISKVNSKLLSSIRYASLIQNGFLQDRQELKGLYSDSFIFNSPKDILSGDFYWFSQKNGHNVIVVADCTGHGVPGAMLTVLGHNALNEIVNVQGEVKPSSILKSLNKVIRAAFSNNSDHLDYGMDITVISVKEETGKLLFAGLVNGLYVLKNKQLQYYPVSPKSFGNDIAESDFTDQQIDLDKKDCLFLCTDGYQDQFSGNYTVVEKFNTDRFEKLLHEIGNGKSFTDSETMLRQTLENWKGKREQIDDILILGIQI
jgi:serine phosphatase RsbU (regulator of sigma subunit)